MPVLYAITKHNRTINRRKWELNELNTNLDSEGPQKSVFTELQKLIVIRKNQKPFHPNAKQEIIEMGNNFFGLIRESSNGEKILIIANLTNKKQFINIPAEFKLLNYDLISGKRFESNELDPYFCVWLNKQ